MTHPRILIAADAPGDARLVAELLAGDFSDIVIAMDAQTAPAEFFRHLPQVLVLAYNTLRRADEYSRELLSQRTGPLDHPHGTVLLCSKDEVHQAYQLCRSGRYNDYVLFWPMTFDAPRLRMAVHGAVRDLERSVATARRAAPVAEQPQPPHPAANLLVVEDDPLQQKLLAFALQELRAELRFAATAEGALAALGEYTPDLVLMDINLPDIDGIEATRRIRAIPRHADLPIIMLTGQSARDLVLQSRASGAQDFLVKPYEREVLLTRIRSVLQQGPERTATAQPPPA